LLDAVAHRQNNMESKQMPDNLNPQSSIGATLLAIGRFNADASVVSQALSAHLRTSAGEPDVRAFLSRMHLLLGEFSRAAAAASVAP
jgi:hypothetical protein